MGVPDQPFYFIRLKYYEETSSRPALAAHVTPAAPLGYRWSLPHVEALHS